MNDFILIHNRGSGANEGDAASSEVATIVAEEFAAHGKNVGVRVVRPEAVEAAIRQAVSEKPAALLVAGGDGTVATAAQCLGGTGIPLGIVPMGTFNLAARDLGVPLDLPDAAKFLASANTFPIDVLEVSGRACLCTLVLGFYPEFSNLFEKRDHGGRWWRKSLKLVSGLRTAFIAGRPLLLEWKSPEKSGSAKSKFASFVPGRYRESAGLIPARTDFQSGSLTGYIGTHRSPAAAMRAIFNYALGKQEDDPQTIVINAPELTLTARNQRRCKVMLDGEILTMNFPIKLRILPRHLHVLTTAEIIAEHTNGGP
ncbi:MAG: diacylglycerol kinase family protein [Verrucomicrobiota bacterium]